MEKIKVGKTFHYRKDGGWVTVQKDSVVDKAEIPEIKLANIEYEVVEEKVVLKPEPELVVEEKPKAKTKKKPVRKGLFG